MAIYELRTYDVVVGKMGEVVSLYKNEGWPALQKHPKKLVGYFTGDIGALNQFGKAEPAKALALLVLMFSLAGVPPMLGFFAKLSVLKAAVDGGMVWLAVAGAVASVIGAFYYLRIVYFMYFGQDQEPAESRMAPVQWAMLIAVSAIMILGAVNLFGIEPVAKVAAEALVR